MGVLLAVAAAAAYGLSDFVGGVASRRDSAWAVAALACLGALCGSILLALVVDGEPTRTHLLWGAMAGVGSGVGSGFLYRGLAAGRMGVVAPLSAVGAAVLPVLVGVGTGDRPALLVWGGIVAALPGIWLVSREPGSEGLTAGLGDGLLAGAGFGFLFIGLGQVPDNAGYWPLVTGQVVSVVAIYLLALALRGSVVPRELAAGWGFVAGLIATGAVVCFMLSTQRGLLSVSSVITSLYPAVTIGLAAATLNERIHTTQAVGLGLCGLAVALVAAG